MRRCTRLATDTRGATLIEFAFVAPVMFLLLMGLSDLAYQSYVQSILTGAMQKAGRDSTIQCAGLKTTALDNAVMSVLRSVVANPSYTSSRKNYSSFANIGPEPYQDNNNNGQYDAASECFTDLNGTTACQQCAVGFFQVQQADPYRKDVCQLDHVMELLDYCPFQLTLAKVDRLVFLCKLP